MPLTEKGETIKAAMVEQYGEKKGEEVFYASKNAGTIKGVDAPAVGVKVNGGPDGPPAYDAAMSELPEQTLTAAEINQRNQNYWYQWIRRPGEVV